MSFRSKKSLNLLETISNTNKEIKELESKLKSLKEFNDDNIQKQFNEDLKNPICEEQIYKLKILLEEYYNDNIEKIIIKPDSIKIYFKDRMRPHITNFRKFINSRYIDMKINGKYMYSNSYTECKAMKITFTKSYVNQLLKGN